MAEGRLRYRPQVVSNVRKLIKLPNIDFLSGMAGENAQIHDVRAKVLEVDITQFPISLT